MFSLSPWLDENLRPLVGTCIDPECTCPTPHSPVLLAGLSLVSFSSLVWEQCLFAVQSILIWNLGQAGFTGATAHLYMFHQYCPIK